MISHIFVLGTPFDGNAAVPGNGGMVALMADDRATVDRVFAIALACGAVGEGEPGLRPHYHATYYGAYFRDLDGNKLCVVCHQPARVGDNQYVLIIHDVDDYPKWKSIFDEAAQIRREAGEIEYRLLSAAGDERRVIHFSRWTSLDDARTFFESPRLAAIRHQAGVRAPEFHYLNGLESAVL